jgi:hypothetical protein
MMKVIFVAIVVALFSISLVTPTQSKTCLHLKNQLLKSIVNRALIQQEDSASNKDKEMAAIVCKVAFTLLKFFGDESLNLGDVSEDDYCRDAELPAEPGPVTNLADVYQVFFDALKNSGIDKIYEQYINCILNRIG